MITQKFNPNPGPLDLLPFKDFDIYSLKLKYEPKWLAEEGKLFLTTPGGWIVAQINPRGEAVPQDEAVKLAQVMAQSLENLRLLEAWTVYFNDHETDLVDRYKQYNALLAQTGHQIAKSKGL